MFAAMSASRQAEDGQKGLFFMARDVREAHMSPWAHAVWKLAIYDCDLYGADVVAAFGEYCLHQRRILLRRPHLAKSLGIVSKMVAMLMRE